MGENEVICNIPDVLTNTLFLFVPKRVPPISLQSPSLGSIVTSDFNQKSCKTVSPKDDWSAIVQPSISNKRLAGCRTGSYNSCDSFSGRLNDLNTEFPAMKQLNSTAASMWSLEDSVTRHISSNWMSRKNVMYESVIYPTLHQRGTKTLCFKSQRKFSCPALFQLQDLSLVGKPFYEAHREICPTKEQDPSNVISTNALQECPEGSLKSSVVSPLIETHLKNYRSKCESWLKEIKLDNFPEN